MAKDLIDEDPNPNGVIPLKILLAPPELDFEPNRPSLEMGIRRSPYCQILI